MVGKKENNENSAQNLRVCKNVPHCILLLRLRQLSTSADCNLSYLRGIGFLFRYRKLTYIYVDLDLAK